MNKIEKQQARVNELLELIKANSTLRIVPFDDHSLGEVIGERAKSRMYENSAVIDLFTEDFRKRKMLQTV